MAYHDSKPGLVEYLHKHFELYISLTKKEKRKKIPQCSRTEKSHSSTYSRPFGEAFKTPFFFLLAWSTHEDAALTWRKKRIWNDVGGEREREREQIKRHIVAVSQFRASVLWSPYFQIKICHNGSMKPVLFERIQKKCSPPFFSPPDFESYKQRIFFLQPFVVT